MTTNERETRFVGRGFDLVRLERPTYEEWIATLTPPRCEVCGSEMVRGEGSDWSGSDEEGVLADGETAEFTCARLVDAEGEEWDGEADRHYGSGKADAWDWARYTMRPAWRVQEDQAAGLDPWREMPDAS